MIPRKHGGTPPIVHGLGGGKHSSATIAELEALLSDLAGNLVVEDGSGDVTITNECTVTGLLTANGGATIAGGHLSHSGGNITTTGNIKAVKLRCTAAPTGVAAELVLGYGEVAAGSNTIAVTNGPAGYPTALRYVPFYHNNKEGVFLCLIKP